MNFCQSIIIGSLAISWSVAMKFCQSTTIVKRADERIVFGNQQNQARVVSKRSDQPTDTPAQGELDEGSEVIVHKEQSVEEDLANRADAARKDFEDTGKIADAMEAAMQSVDNAEADLQRTDAESSPQPSGSEQTSNEAISSPADDTASPGEMVGEGEQEDAQLTVPEEDADIKDLLKVTAEGQTEGQAQTAEQSTEEEVSEQESQDPQLNDFWRQMYQYMDAYPANPRLPFDLYRGRRSLAGSKRAGSRRIKRDLLDDVEYDPAWIRYLYSGEDDGIDTARDDQYNGPTSSVLDMGDSLISDQDDYIPLTDSDAEDLYNELEEYLQWELQRRAGVERLRETLGLSPRQEDISPQEADSRDFPSLYGADVNSGDGTAEDKGLLDSQVYPYATGYSQDEPYYYAAKRNSPSYDLPFGDTEKRYFFPFADEPATHWGAFVPEKRKAEDSDDDERSAFLDDPYLEDYRSPAKRDYNEAIQRLQRLAMALSDNRGPYYTEMVQDQPYKK
ncbi:hypothetical protein ElyMa_005394500 [Elysia marginata]|uniref:Uncharacterized protein n=1 Tax=Elysia marginata TaxID=1093978 RepID=A0AAV4EFQ5_9GAST|nr:hypothetical protein ElyMa_005394500 [Elysia marginata]